MVRQAHHPEPSRRADRIDQNSKFQTIGFFILFGIWILSFGIYLYFGTCILVFGIILGLRAGPEI
jgi:hypothetical protein